MGFVDSDWFQVLLSILEAFLIIVWPCVTGWMGFKFGWKSAKEQSFRKTRTLYHNKLHY